MEVSELQKAVKEKYYPTDVKSGPLFLLAVLFEEVGELAEVVRKNDVSGIEEELVDVFFMILSLANIFGINIEDRLVEKYIKSDPSERWDLPNL